MYVYANTPSQILRVCLCMFAYGYARVSVHVCMWVCPCVCACLHMGMPVCLCMFSQLEGRRHDFIYMQEHMHICIIRMDCLEIRMNHCQYVEVVHDYDCDYDHDYDYTLAMVTNAHT